MTDEPMGLAQVEAKIVELVRLLEQCTLAQRERWEADGAADAAYDIAFAQAYLQAKEGALPGQEKGDSDLTAKHRATLVCSEALSRKNSAHALLESAREAARNYRAALDGLRSINTNVRELTSA
jgi:hypothetical protein